MLYVFLVNNGTMITFDVNLALDTVEKLKMAIEEQYQIPIVSQVLLISGGESLNMNDRVYKYNSAGTDTTSPIFLFAKKSPDICSLISCSQDLEVGEDMKDRVESCLQMEPNMNTVASRTEMAMQLCETDNLLFHACEKLVHDQHLQQQGWASVVANLEDIVESFKNKAKKVEILFRDILKNKNFYLQLLESFEDDKDILSKIPILKGLFPMSESYHKLSLLEWILQKDKGNSLDDLYCLEELQQYDQDKLETLLEEVDFSLKSCEKSDMKEIKGLDLRLQTLDKMMHEARKYFDKQNILMKGFSQNHTRLTDCRDMSILPDLCQTHQEQLKTMLANHHYLYDSKYKCLKAKKELSENLTQRLKWIIHIEEQLKQNDDKLVIFGLRLQKLRNKLELIQNLHIAPRIYLESIVEVLRRKAFSESFYKWSQSVSQIAKQMVESETQLRQLFAAQIENHFLKRFFPGMNDYPQNFINDLVLIDQSLPHITSDDIDYLKAELPDYSSQLVVPSTVPIPLVESGDEVSTEKVAGETKPPDTNQDFTMGTSLLAKDITALESTKFDLEKCLDEKNQLIEDLVAKTNSLESLQCKQKETIDHYSQINCRMIELFAFWKEQFGPELRDHISNYSTEMSDNVANLNGIFKAFQQKSEEKIATLTSEVERLKGEDESKRTKFQEFSAKLEKMIEDSKSANEFITCQLSEFRENQMRCVEEAISQAMTQLNQRHVDDCNSLKAKLTEEGEVQMRKLRDELNQVHKNEVDSLRHRFKLAISTTSIERTSSETSLEKVQLDIVDHSALEKDIQKLNTLLKDMKSDYESRISKLQADYESQIASLKTELENEKKFSINDSLKKFLTDNDLNAEQIVQRLPIHETFFAKLSSTLNVTDIDSCDPAQCKEILATVWKEFKDTNRSLDQLNCRSFISIPFSSSPKQSIESETLYEMGNIDSPDSISFKSCEIGDTVLVYYKQSLNIFIVYTTSDIYHVVHFESLKEYDIEKDAKTNEYPGIIAKVTEKEYCQIKKEGNRYNLPVNTKFYRIKIKQLSKCNAKSMIQQLQSKQMNQSHIPSSSSGNILSSIMSFWGTSSSLPMSRSCNFDN